MSIITRINKAEKRIVDLYNKIKNLPSGGGGVQTISGDFVDNTDPLNPILNDPRPYKVYTALLTQSGTNAPVATVLENTLGEEVTYSREDDDAGTYIINFNQTFTNINKIFFNMGNSNIRSDTIFSIERDNTSPILYTRVQLTATDTLLTNTEIEIRVYN